MPADNETPTDVALRTRFFEHVAPADLEGRSESALSAIAQAALSFSVDRTLGEPSVRVLNPTVESDGWTSRHTVIQACADDMPFLVDSVLGELRQRDIHVHLLVHPQVVVRRSESGVGVVDADSYGAPEGCEVESWMYLEIDRIPADDKRADLRNALKSVLVDVAHACADWREMRKTCLEIVEEIKTAPPASIDPATIEPTIEFLTWLEDNHFTFLGYGEYALTEQDGEPALKAIPETGLGILRTGEATVKTLAPQAQARATEPRLLTLTKANRRSTVHRPVYMDYIGLRRFDEAGNVVSERRFVGLFTAGAYAESVTRLPIIGKKVQAILDSSGYAPDSHTGKDLLGVLEAYPRDELFQDTVERLGEVALEVVHLSERRRSRLFVRNDEFGRFVSALLYVPRDRFNTSVRLRLESLLAKAYNSDAVDYGTRVGEAALAQIHFVVRMQPGVSIPDVDVDELERDLMDATRTWAERLTEEVDQNVDDDSTAGDVLAKYGSAFPEAYKEDFGAGDAYRDVVRLAEFDNDEDLVDLSPRLYQERDESSRERRFKVYRRHELSLSNVLPVFSHFGLEVTDERPYEVDGPSGKSYIYDFGLRANSEDVWGEPGGDRAAGFEAGFAAIWGGKAESDSLNSLVLSAGLPWRDVVILRTLVRYLRQVTSFSLDYIEEALVSNPVLTEMLIELFAARFDPDAARSDDRDAAGQEIRDRIETALDDVASLDHDRIVRAVVSIVTAIVRTNFYQVAGDGGPKAAVSLKILPREISFLPEPRPAFEMWVYAPQVEGVHLRFGKVARGGLRWSDRREDFRTEVLGLVKAQLVKNAVIVPTGSKGGFVAKQLPDPSDRDAWMAEGISSYQTFIGSLLDITDNRVGGDIVPPERVVRHDADDPYLVVAADKGTAKFSDIANGISRDYGFWLDDAFASGGSAGYDHKGMGITARGAWESVKRHFREMGIDTQSEDFTVVGVGDMSGDVFGNGMLLSKHIRLLAAFDHRHIFLDPSPDAAKSFAERQRLFDLPRSSWEDYDESLISEGGGVYPKSAKSILISPQVREALGLEDGVKALPPGQLLKAILLSPADLLWNGGIGTYVKSTDESHADIGDRANDAIRVNGEELRVKVVGEGGNLGMSQLGRIEAAQSGVRINTDAIDNSAGVDTSDHEVNIKIALTGLVQDGSMSMEDRDELLASMTDEVAHRVLRHNYDQNVLIGNARDQGGRMMSVHRRLIGFLSDKVGLDPELEFLPTIEAMREREAIGEGLTSPEFAVILAYAKLALKDELMESEIPDDPSMINTLVNYFPEPLRDKISDSLAEHPLRRQIIVNEIANSIVNRGGVTFAFRATEETGATTAQIARAYVVCREIFDMDGYNAQIEALDNEAPTDLQTEMYLEFRRLMDRSVRWFLNNRSLSTGMAAEIEHFAEPVQQLMPLLGEMLQGQEHQRYLDRAKSVADRGIKQDLALRYSALLDAYSLLDAVELAAEGYEVREVAEVYFAISEEFGIDALLTLVSELPRGDRWSALARGAVRDDLYGVLRALTRAVLQGTDSGNTADERVAAWVEAQREPLSRVSQVLTTVRGLEEPDLAPISVALRTLRGLVRQGSAG
ncbi:NAD-glutamate dehydrogenase [Ornithinimicrobium sp. Arc0846-15]|nr:NAD-glutamate dehydrogenase [Ornithinimicrobium laminariae]